MGCPVRCVFCAQDIQTGSSHCEVGLEARLQKTEAILADREARGLPPPELAFYGGTFTALPEDSLEHCLTFAVQERDAGRITGFRCSTRPDCLENGNLQRLLRAGCNTVELGIQSFNHAALVCSGRGYGREVALSACQQVREAGMALGVQLLPGMPGTDPSIFLSDVCTALQMRAHLLRFYPCLVLEGTLLARWWREGRYQPWDLELTIEELAKGWLLAREAAVPVIRMGLAFESSLTEAVLAGPWHPSLGSRVKAKALLLAVRRVCREENMSLAELEVPRTCQGYFWGHQSELRSAWSALGIRPHNLRYIDATEVRLFPRTGLLP